MLTGGGGRSAAPGPAALGAGAPRPWCLSMSSGTVTTLAPCLVFRHRNHRLATPCQRLLPAAAGDLPRGLGVPLRWKRRTELCQQRSPGSGHTAHRPDTYCVPGTFLELADPAPAPGSLRHRSWFVKRQVPGTGKHSRGWAGTRLGADAGDTENQCHPHGSLCGRVGRGQRGGRGGQLGVTHRVVPPGRPCA